jgi:hypothetical protein
MASRFLRYARLGLGSTLSAGPSATGPARALVPVRVTVGVTPDGAAGSSQPVDVGTVPMLGPGDVAGVDPRVVLRTVPSRGATDHPPEDLAAVDLARADLPWMFTPHGPDPAGRLQPWLALVVVPVELAQLTAADPLPRLTVAADQLPPWSSLHAWAHVQAEGSGDPFDPAAHARSRLLCGRRLAARSSYLACLVPTFQAGVDAGTAAAQMAATAAPAWGAGSAQPTGEITLPVYLSWTFSTGEPGTFEDLARRLVPGEITAAPAGGLVVTGAHPDLPAAPARAVGGALGPTTPPTPPPYPNVAELTAVVDSGDALAPPLYGRWHAAVDRLGGLPAGSWPGQLSRTPEHRVAAGLGVAWVRTHQEELMAACWEQAGEVIAANALLRRIGAATAAATRLYERRVVPLPAAATLLLAGPAAARLRITAPRVRPARTLYGEVAGSCAPVGLLGAPLRRALRRRAPLGRRLDRIARGRHDRSYSPARVVDVIAALPPATVALGPATVRLPPTIDAPPDLAIPGALLDLLATRAAPPPCVPLPVADVAARTRTALAPAAALRLRAAAAVDIPAADAYRGPDGVLVAPSITTPMIRALTSLGQRWVLPSVGAVADDTVGVARPDAAFVEAFLVGLNQEMGRELLWRGFPTDQRGSVFRHFWDRTGTLTPPDPDVPPLHTWTGGLGDQLASGAVGSVLVLRAALLRRFPGTAIYLHEAVRGPVGTPVPALLPLPADWTAHTRQPVSRAVLDPDVLLLGLPVRVDQLRSDPAAGHPGWFVVFQEVPGEQRFGLPAAGTGTAPAGSWTELSWADVTLTGPAAVPGAAGDRTAARYLDVDGTRAAFAQPGSRFQGVTPAWSGDGDAAAHALCRLPFRILVHADRLIP